MHLVYFSHSYRKPDDELNKVFEQLMISEVMTISIDPPSDMLNSAKPERHLRGTDGLVCVLPYRDEGPSKYILYEIRLAMRSRRPLLVFVEDVLPSDIIPSTVLARRFSRRSLLRQVRDQRHALQLFKTYVGETPPPSYQPSATQRSCLIIGASTVSPEIKKRISDQIVGLKYFPVFAATGNDCLSSALPQDEDIRRASFAVAFTENLTPQEYYCLGAARAALTPTITLTGNVDYPYDPDIPKEYQPRYIKKDSSESICETIAVEVSIFEQDYLDLKDQAQVERYRRYKAAILEEASGDGTYDTQTRGNIINNYNGMTTNISGNYGNINIDSSLQNVTQAVNASPNLTSEKREQLSAIVDELRAALKPVADSHPDEAGRLADTAELAVKEATKPKPNPGFLKITTEGLKEAANALSEIAPPVLAVAGKLAQFLVGFGT